MAEVALWELDRRNERLGEWRVCVYLGVHIYHDVVTPVGHFELDVEREVWRKVNGEMKPGESTPQLVRATHEPHVGQCILFIPFWS